MVMGLDTDLTPLPRKSLTMGGTPLITSFVQAKTYVGVMAPGGLHVPLRILSMLLELYGCEATLSRPIRVGCVKRELAGEAMVPVGLPLISKEELIIMITPLPASHFLIMVPPRLPLLPLVL